MTNSGLRTAQPSAMRLIGALACVSVMPLVAEAQPSSNSATIAATPAPASASVVINLIRLLVQEGVLTQAKADALIRQAQDEAAVAERNRAPAVAAAPRVAPGAPAMAEATRNMGSLPPTPGAAAAPSSSVRVTYVPEIVKQQIANDVQQRVMQQAKNEGWGASDLPEWTKRFHLYGDFRLRYEWDLFDPRNVGAFTNYQAINSGNPFDLSQIKAGTALPPLLDTTTNRSRMRLRARLGLNADVTDGVDAGIRLATGNTTNPVSSNTTLGTDLNKDNFLLDLAFLHYQPVPWLSFWAGRFANPWFSTDLVWGPDLAFDGIAGHIEKPVTDEVTPFFTAGAFPIENTSFNFPDQSLDKGASNDKWLYAAQAGLTWKPTKDIETKFGIAYYDYTNIEGQTSGPCYALTATAPCNTDDTRPGFVQQGNTLFAIRDTSPVELAQISSTNNPTNYQYYGLASSFRELNFTTRLDYKHYDPIHVIFDGDFVTNLAFNSRSIAAKNPVNNQGPSPDGGTTAGPWSGGANGFMARLTVGNPQINERWDWNVSAAYKYLESDAVLDAFTDPDFHLGGTNAKGYVLGGNLGIAHNVWLTGRWLSASEITGLPYTVNVVQVDLNARF